MGGSAWAVYKKEVEPKMPTVGGTSLPMFVRITNEFYREGVRRLNHHGEQQKFIKINRSPNASPSSSQHGPSSSHRDKSPSSSQHSPSASVKSPSNKSKASHKSRESKKK